jgi:hypothetical protein
MSITGNARKPFEKGKPFGVRETTPPAVTRDLPIALRTKSRLTVSPRSGITVHLASNSSRCPPESTTISTSRVRSRQKKRLPVRPARRSRSRSWAKTKVSHTAPVVGDCRRVSTNRKFSKAQRRPVSAYVEFWTLDDGLGSIRATPHCRRPQASTAIDLPSMVQCRHPVPSPPCLDD